MSHAALLDAFVDKLKTKTKQVNQASWILETTGSEDAAMLRAELEVELRMLLNDRAFYDKLQAWFKDEKITDPTFKRQVNVLTRMIKPNLIDKRLLENIAQQEANLSLLFSNFRAELQGKKLSDNEIKNILKNETDVDSRKATWDASKQIGAILAPHVLKLVHLRNEAARSIGFANYFEMQLELQEVDSSWLFSMLKELADQSNQAYTQLITMINKDSAERFKVSEENIGPWAWAEPFCQEDPVDAKELDAIVEGINFEEAAKNYYATLGLAVEDVLKRSDNYERPGKCQHAFCMHIDRAGDVRTLNNLKPTLKWLETLLHELGHAVYEKGYDNSLPWLLKEPPHMITTEAMALLAGRQAYRSSSLALLTNKQDSKLFAEAEESLKRRQLIFSRWVLVMTFFERELYRNPDQDLNQLWWSLVAKYQKINCAGSPSGCDWAAKYHISLAPVYYFSYLLGELFASSLEVKFPTFTEKHVGKFLDQNLFQPGNGTDWKYLISKVINKDLSGEDWLSQFVFSCPQISNGLG